MRRNQQEKVQKKPEKETKEEEEESEELLLFQGNSELLPGDILTAIEYLGYDQIAPELYQIINNLERQVTGKMSVQNMYKAVNEGGIKPNEIDLKKVYEVFVKDKKNGIEENDLIRVAPVVDEDPEQDFKEYLEKIAENGKSLSYEEMEDIMLKDMSKFKE